MYQNKIDIVIPLYNQENKIKYCLESLWQQTFQHFFIILVNDGSTDKSLDIVYSFIKRNNVKNIKVINQTNKGANIARNTGAQYATEKYILFCDSDIIMKDDMLEKMFMTLEKNTQYSYAYSSFRFGFKKFKLYPFNEEQLKIMPYIHTTSLLQREHFSGFDPEIKRLQDWDLWLTLLERGYKGIWIPEILFKVQTGGTMSTWIPKFFINYFPYGKQAKDYLKAVEIIKIKHHLYEQ